MPICCIYFDHCLASVLDREIFAVVQVWKIRVKLVNQGWLNFGANPAVESPYVNMSDAALHKGGINGPQ